MFLENPADNPCWGCGPGHARGLHLRPQRLPGKDGDEVLIQYEPKPDEIGWPGLFHAGMHVAVLYEASYWAALELGGKVHTSQPDLQLRLERWPRVGRTFTTTARIVERGPEGLRIEARSATEEGKPLGFLGSHWKPASRAQVERAGLRIPGYLLDDMAP